MIPHAHRERVPGCFRCELSVDEATPILATFPSGTPIADFTRTTRALARKHGDNLVMRQHDDRLLILDRRAPEFDCWCGRCHVTVNAWVSAVVPDWCPTGAVIVCPDCGSKRCPRAANHASACNAEGGAS